VWVQWIWDWFAPEVWQVHKGLDNHSGSTKRTVRLNGVNVSLELPLGGAVSLWALTLSPCPAPHPHHPPHHIFMRLQRRSAPCSPALAKIQVSSVHLLSLAGASRFWSERPASAPHLHPHHPPSHPLATLRVLQHSTLVLQLALRSILSSCWSSPRPRASGEGVQHLPTPTPRTSPPVSDPASPSETFCSTPGSTLISSVQLLFFAGASRAWLECVASLLTPAPAHRRRIFSHPLQLNTPQNSEGTASLHVSLRSIPSSTYPLPQPRAWLRLAASLLITTSLLTATLVKEPIQSQKTARNISEHCVFGEFEVPSPLPEMPNITTLPRELQDMIFSYIEDGETLEALALTSRHTTQSALMRYSDRRIIHVSADHAVALHTFFSRLSSLANSDLQPPDVAIIGTGCTLTDNTIRHASVFKTLKLHMPFGYHMYAPEDKHIDSRLVDHSLSLASQLDLDASTVYRVPGWQYSLYCTSIHMLIRRVLRFAEHIHTLELKESHTWMSDVLNAWSLFPNVRTIRFSHMGAIILCQRSYDLLLLSNLRKLEFTASYITCQREKGQSLMVASLHLTVTNLQFTNCYAEMCPMGDFIYACIKLEKFKYTLLWEYCQKGLPDFDLMKLVHALLQHKDTLRHLTIRSLDFRITDLDFGITDRCLFLKEIGRFEVLESLVINQEHLHLEHKSGSSLLCQEQGGKQKQGRIFEPAYPEPRVIMLALPASLQRLEVHLCDVTVMTEVLLDVMQHLKNDRESKSNQYMPHLVTIRASFVPVSTSSADDWTRHSNLIKWTGERSYSDVLRGTATAKAEDWTRFNNLMKRTGGLTYTEALRRAAAEVPRFLLKLEEVPRGQIKEL
jgi:hypothetical protein